MAALHDREARVRAAAVLSLGRLGDVESALVIVESLSDPAEIVRMAAALALGEVEPAPVSEALILKQLRHPDATVRLAATQALLGLERISFSGELVAALRDTNAKIRQGAAAALGETGDVRAVPDLLAVLQRDAIAGVRAEAAFRLGKIGEDRVTNVLARVSEADSDAMVRGWARWAFHQFKQSHESGSGTRLNQ